MGLVLDVKRGKPLPVRFFGKIVKFGILPRKDRAVGRDICLMIGQPDPHAVRVLLPYDQDHAAFVLIVKIGEGVSSELKDRDLLYDGIAVPVPGAVVIPGGRKRGEAHLSVSGSLRHDLPQGAGAAGKSDPSRHNNEKSQHRPEDEASHITPAGLHKPREPVAQPLRRRRQAGGKALSAIRRVEYELSVAPFRPFAAVIYDLLVAGELQILAAALHVPAHQRIKPAERCAEGLKKLDPGVAVLDVDEFMIKDQFEIVLFVMPVGQQHPD